MTDDLPPSFGKYTDVQRLGEGGFGEVYRAVDTTLNRPVALKMPHRELLRDPQFAAQFRSEAQTAAQLDHPNIVRIYSVGEFEGRPYIEMELVEGQTLADLINAKGCLTPEEAFAIIEPICAALEEAHRKGIIHQDIKPSNILIRSSDNQVLVSDFGLAKSRETSFPPSLDSSNPMVGTPRYMPPERANPKLGNVGPQSDIYSLGAVLYEMLTGRAPFDGQNFAQLVFQHTGEEPKPPSTLNVGLSKAVESVVLKALAKKPKDRFGTASDMANALRLAIKKAQVRGVYPQDLTAKSPSQAQPGSQAHSVPPAISPISPHRGLPVRLTLGAIALIAVVAAAFILTRLLAREPLSLPIARITAAPSITATGTSTSAPKASPSPRSTASPTSPRPSLTLTPTSTQTTAPSIVTKPANTPTPTGTPTYSPRVAAGLTATAIAYSTVKNVRAQALSWPVVEHEAFDSTASRWPITLVEDSRFKAVRSIDNGLYTWNIHAQQGIIWPVLRPDAIAYDDFSITTTVSPTVSSGDLTSNGRRGLVFRWTDLNNFYWFSIGPSGTGTEGAFGFTLQLVIKGTWLTLAAKENVDAIHPVSANRLQVIGHGSDFYLFINDEPVGTVNNPRLPQGQVGLGAEVGDSQDAIISFDEFELRIPPRAAATGTAVAAATATQKEIDRILLDARSWPRRLNGTFDNNLDGWYVGPYSIGNAQAQFAVVEGRYEWKGTSQNTTKLFMVPTTSAMQSVYVRATVWSIPDSTGSPGLVFRYRKADTDFEQYYGLVLSPAGEFSIFEQENGRQNPLVRATKASVLRSADWNTLEVVALNHDLFLWVNDHFEQRIHDERLTGGMAGLLADLERGGPFNLAFGSFDIRAPAASAQ